MSAPAARPLVLLVDDDPGLRSIVSEILGEEGYDTVDAADGREALAIALHRHIDLILLDLAMPEYSGEDFGREYRDRGGRAPIILMTASRPGHATTATETSGAVALIRKPFDIDELLRVVATAVGRSSRGA